MPDARGVSIGVLVERIKAVQQDVAELRQSQREDHHRLRGVESSVRQMIDAQRAARESEASQYRRMATSIQVGGLAMAVAMVVLTVVTLLAHTG